MIKSFLKYFIVVLMTSMICVTVFSAKMFQMRGILDNNLKKPVGSALKSITDDMEHGRFEVAKSKLGILSSEWSAFSQGNCLDRVPGSIMAKFSVLDNASVPTHGKIKSFNPALTTQEPSPMILTKEDGKDSNLSQKTQEEPSMTPSTAFEKANRFLLKKRGESLMNSPYEVVYQKEHNRYVIFYSKSGVETLSVPVDGGGKKDIKVNVGRKGIFVPCDTSECVFVPQL